MKVYKKRLKLKESLKDKITICIGIVLIVIGVIMLVDRTKEIDNNPNAYDKQSIPISVNRIK